MAIVKQYDSRLTKYQILYINAPDAFIGRRIFPPVKVDHRGGKLFDYSNEHMQRLDTTRRPGTEAKSFDTKIGTPISYSCENQAFKLYIDDDDYKDMQRYMDLKLLKTRLAQQVLSIDGEYKVLGDITDSAKMIYYTTLSGTSQWSNYNNSDPEGDFRTGKQSVKDRSLFAANSLVIGYEAALTLGDHPVIKDIRKRTDPMYITKAGLPSKLWGLDVMEATASNLASNIGQVADFDSIIGKHAIICYIAKKPVDGSLTLGMTPEWQAPKTRSWRNEDRHSTVVEPNTWTDSKLISAACGFLFKNCIA